MASQVLWTAADGVTVIDLTDTAEGYTVLGEGTRGLRSVEYELSTVKYAGLDGEDVQAIRASANQPTLGLLVAADDETEFRTRARGLRWAMRPKAGLGTLTVRGDDGETRSLDCYCIGGLEGDEAAALDGRWWRLALKFYAPDPWWYGESVTVEYGGLDSVTAFFPLFPTHLSSSTVAGAFTVDLSGTDAPAYPVWTITGPGTGLTLTNVTTGQVITTSATLTGGQSMTIDTRPGFQSIRRNDGTNLMSTLSSDPALWPLQEDLNSVTAALTGATSASKISVTYAPRYAGI